MILLTFKAGVRYILCLVLASFSCFRVLSQFCCFVLFCLVVMVVGFKTPPLGQGLNYVAQAALNLWLFRCQHPKC